MKKVIKDPPISRYEFLLYEKVRNSGQVNMIDINEVIFRTGLTSERIMKIIDRYSELKIRYAPRNEVSTAQIRASDLKVSKVYRGVNRGVRRILSIRNGNVRYEILTTSKRWKPVLLERSAFEFANWVREAL